MPLTIVSNCEEDDIIDPFCVDDGCIPKRELARVRSLANYRMGWFKNTFKPLLTAFSNAQTADPYNQAAVDTAYNALLAAWQQGMADKNVYVIAETNGSFDGGTPIVGAGYGDQKERLIGYTFVLNGIDPLPGGNFAHWNTITKASNWGTAFRSETFTHFTEVATSKTFKQEIADDIAGERTIAVETKWDGEQPAPYADLVDIFKCSAAVAPPTGLQAPTLSGQRSATKGFLTFSNPANGTDIEVERGLDGTTFGTTATVGYNQTSYTDSGRTPGTDYFYRTRTKNANNNTFSPYSSVIQLAMFDQHLLFSGTAASASGVQANTENNVADADAAFDFDGRTYPTGAGQTMGLTLGGTQFMQVTFPAIYLGDPFAVFDLSGNVHFGVFTNGTVAF